MSFIEDAVARQGDWMNFLATRQGVNPSEYVVPLPVGEIISNLSMGEKPLQTLAVPDDIKQRYLGRGTDANKDALHNSKYYPLGDQMAAQLNTIAQQAKGRSNMGWFVDRGQKFFNDPQAKIAVPVVSQGISELCLIPGSDFSTVQSIVGASCGLVMIKSVTKKTFVRIGSPGWLKVIKEMQNQISISNAVATELSRFLAQSIIYGSASIYDIFRQFNVGIVASNDGTIGINQGAHQLCKSGDFVNTCSAVVKKTPGPMDEVLKGYYAHASLLMRHAHLTDALGNTAAEKQQSLITSINQGDITNKFSGKYKKSDGRKGLTAFPLRDASGSVLDPYTSTGFCPPNASGPGIGGSISQTHKFAVKANKGSRTHKSKTGEVSKTYYCANTPDASLDFNSKKFEAGQFAALPNQSAFDYYKSVSNITGKDPADIQRLRQELITSKGRTEQAYMHGINPNLVHGNKLGLGAYYANVADRAVDKQAKHQLGDQFGAAKLSGFSKKT